MVRGPEQIETDSVHRHLQVIQRNEFTEELWGHFPTWEGVANRKNHECSQTRRAVITEKLMTVNSKHALTCSRYCSNCGFADLFWLLDYQWRDRSFFFFTRPLVFSYPQPHIHTFSGKYADTVYCPRSLVQVLPDSSTKYERYEKKTLLSRPRLREIKYMYTTFEKDLEIILQKKKWLEAIGQTTGISHASFMWCRARCPTSEMS